MKLISQVWCISYCLTPDLEEIVNFLEYIENMEPDEVPDYEYLKGVFQNGLDKLGGDFEFDWVVMNVNISPYPSLTF